MTAAIEQPITILTESDSPSLISFGLPLAQGCLHDARNLRFTQNERSLTSHAEARNHWPDGSIRWCWAQAITQDKGPLSFHIDQTKAAQSGEPCVQTTSNPPAQVVVTGKQHNVITIDLNTLSCTEIKAAMLSVELHLSVSSQALVCSLKHTQKKTYGIEHSHTFSGTVVVAEQRTLKITLVLNLCQITGQLSSRVTIHNPHRAAHTNGRWDLGDAMSIIIDRFSLRFSLPETRTGLILETAPTPENPQTQHSKAITALEQGQFTLKQQGSGGNHWQSPIHWDAHQQLSVKAQGYTLQFEHKKTLDHGLRAQPVGVLLTEDKSELSFAITQHNFWQQFPGELVSSTHGLEFSLFADTTELQGGESKTWIFSGKLLRGPINERQLCDLLLRPPTWSYEPQYLDACQLYPHISFKSPDTEMSDLLNQGLYGKESFFSKREQMDVFGWRHFGELHADHESSLSENPETFISHYNNQYDPLMGMSLQYLKTQNTDWLALMHPLAQHTVDIDIYDTTEDKAEYNGGLFWHTDHYLPAYTSTHRSYSKYHSAAYEGYAGGGGPGGQHCYTTGLMLQYWLFGHEQARERTLKLARWISAFYNGSGSLLDRTFRLITMDFKQNELTNIGIKKPGYRYPLDRGTGNYMIALMDALEIQGQWQQLNEVGAIIRQCVHPCEDLKERNLLDVENAWFYTVFLQAVARFLCLKEQLKHIDVDYWYARHSFMHYLDWMLKHERPYLDDPEQLEFPNDTWAAQDLRKANLFYFGYYFSGKEQPEFLEAAEYFYQYVCSRLSESSEKHYTRILAILMQNQGVREKFKPGARSSITWQQPAGYGTAPSYAPLGILKTYWQDMIKLLKQFSFKKELEWVKIRLGR